MQDHSLEVSLISQYEENMTKLTEYCKQRAKKHWATQGDRNTSFFHNIVLKRRRRNRIVSIRDKHGKTLHDPDDIVNEFVTYFQNIFQSSCSNNTRPFLGTIPSQEQEGFINSIPDKQEIWETLKAMRKNASPGPYGFNISFYISAWEWIGDDVAAQVKEFYLTGILPSHVSDTHIAIIPKKAMCQFPSDFCPISLCNVIYKLIAKTLANRLKEQLLLNI
jgi:hypothetical protein